MSNPEIPQKAPYPVEVSSGKKYFWCACGKSARQPFCDGSHKETGFTPVKLSLNEKTKVWLCGCKRSGNKPHCDGTHKTLPD